MVEHECDRELDGGDPRVVGELGELLGGVELRWLYLPQEAHLVPGDPHALLLDETVASFRPDTLDRLD